MGVCKYCGESAGFLKNQHKECVAKHDANLSRMVELTRESIVKNKDFQQLNSQLISLSKSGFVSKNEIKHAVLNGWSNAVEDFLDDGVLSEEEANVEAFQSFFKLEDDELNHDGSYTKVVQAATLRDILDGNIPQRINLVDDVPFNFQKNEELVWIFKYVDYYEEKKKTHYEGGHHGFSVKVSKGVYYRAGTFRGHPVETSQIIYMDSGVMGVTNKHIYFTGPSKSFRVKFEKIVSFTPYDDGIGLQRDAATAKPQIFVTGEGWFTYNLITNMAKM